MIAEWIAFILYVLPMLVALREPEEFFGDLADDLENNGLQATQSNLIILGTFALLIWPMLAVVELLTPKGGKHD